MTSAPVYPSDYYYPEFLNSRSDDPRSLPSPSLLNITTTEQLTNRTNKSSTKNLAMDISTNQGLPDADITESMKTDIKTSLIRNPAERNIPRLIVNNNILKQDVRAPIIPITNLDNKENNQTNKTSDENQSNKTKPIEPIKSHLPPTLKPQQKHQIVKVIEDEQPVDDYWKKEILIDDEGVVAIEPIKYDKNTYEGPFGLTRKGSFIFYIGMAIFTLIAAVFLIMTGVFYSQNYPDSSNNTGKVAGMGICGFLFYLGLQLILIGLWHQKHRQENPIRKIKKSRVHNDSTDHLKTSMEHNESYDYTYQPPYGYYYNQPYASNVNEQMFLQQPGAGYYDSVVWPSNVEVEPQPDAKFLQPMEWSLGPQLQSTVNDTSSTGIDTSASNTNLMKKSQHHHVKPVETQPSVGDFDSLQLNSTVIEQPLPILPKAPETTELINSIAQMESTTEKLSTNDDTSTKKYDQMNPIDNQTEISTSSNQDKHRHHHHHRHRRHHHSDHHHRRHRPHHDHHRRHHHHQHHRSPSPCSECTRYSHDHYHDHIFGHQHQHQHPYHHHHHPVSFPKIMTPHLPKIITPTPRVNTTVYRETGMNTGNETKIMRDSSVTADLEDIPIANDNRLDKIPIIRRTIIVEPYPAQPSSQIIVKPQSDMTGKIRLGKNQQFSGDNETIIYPTTAFLTKKKSKKKKQSTIVNNNIIEDLKLEDINDDNDDNYYPNLKIKSLRTSPKKTIKNAFYN